jgi:hypothetical protein
MLSIDVEREVEWLTRKARCLLAEVKS